MPAGEVWPGGGAEVRWPRLEGKVFFHAVAWWNLAWLYRAHWKNGCPKVLVGFNLICLRLRAQNCIAYSKYGFIVTLFYPFLDVFDKLSIGKCCFEYMLWSAYARCGQYRLLYPFAVERSRTWAWLRCKYDQAGYVMVAGTRGEDTFTKGPVASYLGGFISHQPSKSDPCMVLRTFYAATMECIGVPMSNGAVHTDLIKKFHEGGWWMEVRIG